MQHGNWIGGERRAAADGDRFVLRAPGRSKALKSYPRSRTPDLLAALAAMGAGGWSRFSEEDRRGRIRRAMRAFSAEADPHGTTAAVLGWSAEELTANVRPALTSAALGSDPPPWEAAGPILCAPHWSELAGGLVRALGVLLSGRAVCLLVPTPLSGLGDRLAECLIAAGIPGDGWALLHDDGGPGQGAQRCGLALAAAGAFAGVCLSGPDEAPNLSRATGRTGGREIPVGAVGAVGMGSIGSERAPWVASGAQLPFGTGVVEREPAAVQFHRLSRDEAVVTVDEDPERAAVEIVERSLGRSVLGGQLPGQVGLATCHPLLFSRFTAAVLTALEGEPAERPGALYPDPDHRGELERLRDLGLDEGAVLIHERPVQSGSGGAAGSPSGARGGSLGRLVFTNVEPEMRIAGVTGPVPLLLLMRGEA